MHELIFLGTGCPNDSRQRGEASIFFDGLLMDCGDGCADKLINLNLIDNIQAILITHLHSDHIKDIAKLLSFIALNSTELKTINLFSPPGLSKILDKYTNMSELLSYLSEKISIELHEGLIENKCIGDKIISAYEMNHHVEDYGYLIEFDGAKLFYTGDTRKCTIQIKADYVIHDSMATESEKGIVDDTGHSTAGDAALFAKEVDAKVLFLTHINDDWISNNDALINEAKMHFKGKIYIAEDLARFSLKSKSELHSSLRNGKEIIKKDKI